MEKQRRGLSETGSYEYSYDALNRLQKAKKDGKVQRIYSYDAFNNRTELAEEGRTIAYTYNALNRLTQEIQRNTEGGNEGEEERIAYIYDRRGDLQKRTKNGVICGEYVYGTFNQLEQATNIEGKTAQYLYNGLGFRVGEKCNNVKMVKYTIDLTRPYYNLLCKEEEGLLQTFLWDGTAVGIHEKTKKQYYLQDEMGSPVRLVDESGLVSESYGYDEFGCDLYPVSQSTQIFAYTGYQRDDIAGTYFAQAREYDSKIGRFYATDIVKGETANPLTLNEYVYCGNQPFYYFDPNGLFWHIIAGAVVGAVANAAITIGTGIVTGNVPDLKSIGAAALGGAVSGGLTAAFGPVAKTAGIVLGGAVERAADGWLHGDSNKEIMKDVVTGVGADLAMCKVSKVLKNTPQVKTIVSKLESTEIGEKIKTSKANYNRQITRGRNSWDFGKGKAIHMRYKTYRNGIIGVTGDKAIEKMSMLFQNMMPGTDIKKELKKVLEVLYDEVGEWNEYGKAIEESAQQYLEKISLNVTNEEMEIVLCVE